MWRPCPSCWRVCWTGWRSTPQAWRLSSMKWPRTTSMKKRKLKTFFMNCFLSKKLYAHNCMVSGIGILTIFYDNKWIIWRSPFHKIRVYQTCVWTVAHSRDLLLSHSLLRGHRGLYSDVGGEVWRLIFIFCNNFLFSALHWRWDRGKKLFSLNINCRSWNFSTNFTLALIQL